jgi:hypothetical protein
LSRESDCEAYDDLEPNPFPGACRFVHGVEEAAAYRAERAADEPEERYDADFRKSKALRDSGEGEWDDQGQHADTRADRVRVMDGLKVERQVVQDDEVGAWEEDHEEGAGPDVALCELWDVVSACWSSHTEDETYNARHDHGVLLLEHLPCHEGSQKENEADEEADDSSALPGVCLSAILQRKDVASEQADHKTCAHEVELQDGLFPGRFHGLCGLVRLEEEECDYGSDAANWQVDPEALWYC